MKPSRAHQDDTLTFPHQRLFGKKYFYLPCKHRVKTVVKLPMHQKIQCPFILGGYICCHYSSFRSASANILFDKNYSFISNLYHSKLIGKRLETATLGALLPRETVTGVNRLFFICLWTKMEEFYQICISQYIARACQIATSTNRPFPHFPEFFLKNYVANLIARLIDYETENEALPPLGTSISPTRGSFVASARHIGGLCFLKRISIAVSISFAWNFFDSSPRLDDSGDREGQIRS